MSSDEGTSRQFRQIWHFAMWARMFRRFFDKTNGEEPNSEPLLSSTERLGSGFPNQGDDSTSADTVVLKSLVKTMKARPLDLADDFEIVEGVPTFTWTGSLQWTSFHLMALSSDRTRMAFVKKEQTICVYDLLDNFTLIAESEESFNGVRCVEFPSSKSDEIVVVHGKSKISVLSIPIASSEGEGHSTMELSPKKLRISKTCCRLPQCDWRKKVFFLIACDTSEKWLFASDPSTTKELNLFSISAQEFHRVKILTHERFRSCAMFMSIPQRALVSVVEIEDNFKTKKTWIWKGIDFKEDVIQQRPIEIEGQGMGFCDCGKYFLVWDDEPLRKGVLDLYDIEALDGEPPLSMWSKSLREGIMDLKAKLLDRNSIELNNVDLKCGENIPIVALLVAHHDKVSLSFWDPPQDETSKQIEFTTRSMIWSPDMKLEFCLSLNMKWIVLRGWSKGRFALFSLESKRLVWDVDLHDEDLAGWPYSAFEFDASCTKLIVNCSKKLYAFAPPCLIEDYKIEMRGAKHELHANNNDLLAPLTWDHRRLLPNELLKRLIVTQLGLRTKQYIDYFDVALSKALQTIAILVWKKRPPLLLVGPLDACSSKHLWKYITTYSNSCPRLCNIRIMVVRDCLAQLDLNQRNRSSALFLYPNQERTEDYIVIFALDEGLSAMFEESTNSWTQPVSLSEEQCFQIRQSNDGHCVTCAMSSGVMIINLNRRQPTQFVTYDNKSLRLIHDYSPNRSSVDSTNVIVDREVVLNIGEDVTRTPLVSEHTHDREVGERTHVGCCFVDDKGCSLLASLEFKKEKMTPISLCVVSPSRVVPEEDRDKRICKKEWNPHMRNMMHALFKDDLQYCSIKFDEGSGHLWCIGITKEESKSSIVFVPFGPYSLDNCVPNLYMKDYPQRMLTMTELERLLHSFGDNFLSMTFNNKSNCDIVLEEEQGNLLGLKISAIADKEKRVLSEEWKKRFPVTHCDDHLVSAIKGNDYEWVKQCLDIAIEERDHEGNASLIKKCFSDLWKKFPSLIVSMLEEDKLISKICDVEIDAAVFKSDDHLRARIGTCDSFEDWVDASQRGESLDYWKKSNKKREIQVIQSGNEATTKASLMVFYLENACKVGIKGIIRSLLMHNAPSHIFKSSLIKWVIIFKWETVWRRHSMVNCAIYLLYIGTFSTYTVCIGLRGESLENDGVECMYLLILLCVTCLMAIYMAYKEVIQLITCCKDAEKLFGSRLHGLKSYFGSPWNVIELVSYIMLLVVFCLHIVCLYDTSSSLPFLYTCSAVELLVMWKKIWYFAQAFKSTGALALMVENVFRDCMPFLVLTLTVLAGFGFAMFAVFQSILYKLDFEEDNETRIAIDQGFGNPVKSMLTLFYAMVGMFDPTFFLDCGKWSILVIAIFVFYISMQMILMLNMLIALMSDTFDRVKSTEEEQLLLGRARFIDACEAQLTRKQINDIERNVDKWLFVIFPKDRKESYEVKLWQGRVSTISNRVEISNKAFRDSLVSDNKDIKEKMDERFMHLHREIELLKSNAERDTQSLKQMIKECLVETKAENST